MKGISILLFIVGVFGIIFAFMAFGDIGVACGVGGVTALLSGAGFWIAGKKMKA